MTEKASAEDIETGRRIFEDHITLIDDPVFSDVVVVVGDKEFPCHLATLAPVSDFFKVAFQTDMREAQEKRISLNGIDKDVFSTILKCIYGGKYVLTEDNLFAIWAAADQLQITFLIDQCASLCEKLLKDKLSTENCLEYLCKVRLLDEKAKDRVLKFICKNFSGCKLQLPSNLKKLQKAEIKILAADNQLKVENEDRLIGRILVWAEYKPNTVQSESPKDDSSSDTYEDKGGNSSIASSMSPAQDLADVLECTRYMLISGSYLHGNLARHPLVKSEPRCLALLEKVTEYQAQPHLHQTWCPTAAIHREHSQMTNVLLMRELNRDGQFTILCLARMEWKTVTLTKLGDWQPGANLFCYGNRIVALSGGNKMSEYSLRTKTWRSADLPCLNNHMNVIGDKMHFYNFDQKEGTLEATTLTDVDQPNCTFSNHFVDERLQALNMECVDSIGNSYIIFFNRKDTSCYTIVSNDPYRRCYEVEQNQFQSRSRLVTFAHDKDLFVLQENGHLWKIQQGDTSEEIAVGQEESLWDGQVSLNGAVLYGEQLMVVGDFQDQTQTSEQLDISLAGVFQSVRKIKTPPTVENKSCGISLAVLPKSIFE